MPEGEEERPAHHQRMDRQWEDQSDSLMNVYLDVGNPRGSGFWNEEYKSKGRGMGSLVYEQPVNKVDGSYHSKEGSK